MQEMRIDRFDLVLLQALQQDSHLTNAELGARISLSPSQVSRRIQRLEELGVIKGYTALLDGEVLGLGVMAYAQIILERHDKARGSEFESAVAKLAAVVECFAVTGEADYMLRIVAPDLATFSDLVMKQLVLLPGVAQVKTNITLSQIKQTHQLPLDHLGSDLQHRRRVTLSE